MSIQSDTNVDAVPSTAKAAGRAKEATMAVAELCSSAPSAAPARTLRSTKSSRATTAGAVAGTLDGVTARPTGRDWAVAVGLTLLSALSPRASGPIEPKSVAAWVGLLGIGLLVAEGLPLAWRRIRPVVVAAVVVVASAGY